MSAIDTYERMVTDRVRSECREQVRAIVEPAMRAKYDAARAAGADHIVVTDMELQLMQWFYLSMQVFPSTDAVTVHMFDGLRMVVEAPPALAWPANKRVTT